MRYLKSSLRSIEQQQSKRTPAECIIPLVLRASLNIATSPDDKSGLVCV